MDSEKLSQRYWEQVAHTELESYRSQERTQADIEFIEQTLNPSDHILDLGCGWGRITIALALCGYRAVGIDLSENLIAYAKKNAMSLNLQVRFDVGSLLNVPSPAESFDKVICYWGVFNHLLTESDQIDALNEMYRILKPKGIALIEMGDVEQERYQHHRATVGYGHENRIWDSQYKDGTPPNVLYLHDKASLEQIANQSNFEKFEVKSVIVDSRGRTAIYLFKS